MKQTIGYCGLDCEKCDAFIATLNNDDALRKKTAELWSLYNNVTITPEMINCQGCRIEGCKTYFCSDMCEIRKCASKKNFNTCGDCQKLKECQVVEEIHKNNPEAINNL